MIEPRDYQSRAVERALRLSGKPIFVSPTGSGKTIMQVMAAKAALDNGRQTAIYTPRQEIFEQTHKWANKLIGAQNVSILRAGETWDSYKPVHIVSWPTAVRRLSKNPTLVPKVDFVQADEAHLTGAKRIHELLLHHESQSAHIIGWTATPARPTGTGLGMFWDQIVPVTTVPHLLKDGFLNPNEYWGGSYASVEGLKVKQGDYDNEGLAGRSMPLIGDVVENWLRLARDRHTIVFAVNIPHAEALADRFTECGINAVALHNKVNPRDRKMIVKQFRRGTIQVLVNVTIASYGFDAPTVDCVVLARRTRSIVLHLQMLGRGMRPGVEPYELDYIPPDWMVFPKRATMVLDHADAIRSLGMAEDLYQWELTKGKQAADNVSKKARERNKIQDNECPQCKYKYSGRRDCPKCGFERPIRSEDVASTDDELVRLSREREKPVGEGFPKAEMFYRMLRGVADEKGYKPDWVAVKYKDKVGNWPPNEWKHLASIPPNEHVNNYLKKEAQNYARRKAYARRSKKQSHLPVD